MSLLRARRVAEDYSRADVARSLRVGVRVHLNCKRLQKTVSAYSRVKPKPG